MAMPFEQLRADLIRTALQFHKLRLWLEIPGDGSFLLRLPGDEHSMVVFVMGQLREHFGLTVFRGKDAIHDARMPLITNEPRAQLGNLRSTALLVTFSRLEALPRYAQRFLEAAGFIGRPESTAPRFLSLPQRQHAALPSRGDMRVLLAAMSAILAIRTSERLALGNPLFDDTLPAYHVSPDGSMIGRTIENLVPIETRFGRALLDLASIAWRPVSASTWLVGFADLPVDESTPGRPADRRFVGFDAASGASIHRCCPEDSGLIDLGRELRTALSNCDTGGMKSRPKEIVFHDWRLGYRLLSPALSEIGIVTKHVSRSDEFDRYASALAAKLRT